MQDAAGKALRTRRCICNQDRCGRRTTDELLLAAGVFVPALVADQVRRAWRGYFQIPQRRVRGKGLSTFGQCRGSAGHTASRRNHTGRIAALCWPMLLLCWLGCEAQDVASVVLVRVGSRCRGCGSVRQGQSGSCARTSLPRSHVRIAPTPSSRLPLTLVPSHRLVPPSSWLIGSFRLYYCYLCAPSVSPRNPR